MKFKVEISGFGGLPVEIEKFDGATINLEADGDTSVDSIVKRGFRQMLVEFKRNGYEVEDASIVRIGETVEIRDSLINFIRSVKPVIVPVNDVTEDTEADKLAALAPDLSPVEIDADGPGDAENSGSGQV